MKRTMSSGVWIAALVIVVLITIALVGTSATGLGSKLVVLALVAGVGLAWYGANRYRNRDIVRHRKRLAAVHAGAISVIASPIDNLAVFRTAMDSSASPLALVGTLVASPDGIAWSNSLDAKSTSPMPWASVTSFAESTAPGMFARPAIRIEVLSATGEEVVSRLRLFRNDGVIPQSAARTEVLVREINALRDASE